MSLLLIALALLLAGCAAPFRLPDGVVWGFTGESPAGARVVAYVPDGKQGKQNCEDWRAKWIAIKSLTDAEARLQGLTLSACRQLSVTAGSGYWVSRVPHLEIGDGAATLADCEKLRGPGALRGSACTEVAVTFVP
jgi:hypothetical protein